MKKILLSIYKILFTLFNKLYSLIIPPPIYNTDDTIEKLINFKCSMSRYGDGEFSLMKGKDLKFQPYSYELASRLKEIIKSNNDNNHIVCIPYAI